MQQEAGPPDPPLGVGLACFNFRSTRLAPFTMTGEEYVNDLGQTLADIPAVETLELDFPQEFRTHRFAVDRDPPVMSEGVDFFPFWEDGTVAFTVHIPERVQEDLLDIPAGTGSRLYTQHFYVETDWYYEMPVTLVHPLDPTAESDPGESVIVVRRFLEAEIDKTRNSIELDFLGPSPMHADIFLHPGNGPRPKRTPPFIRRNLDRMGYMRYDFDFDQSAYRTDLDAVRNFFQAVKREMDLFYRIVHIEWLRLHRWDAINDNMNDLIDKRRRSGIGGWLQGTFRTGRLVSELGIDLVQFSADDLARYQDLSSTFKLHYELGTTYLRESVEDQWHDWTSYPTDQFTVLLQQFEARRITDRELIFALGGALIGAAAGVLAA